MLFEATIPALRWATTPSAVDLPLEAHERITSRPCHFHLLKFTSAEVSPCVHESVTPERRP
jgi:hypothetical protein